MQPCGPDDQASVKASEPDSSSEGGPEPLDATGELGPAELIERHQRGVWRYLRMLGCDSSTADDLTQETFLQVHRSLPSFGGRSNLLTWIFGIAYRQSLRRLRKRRYTMIAMSDDIAVDENSTARIEQEDWVRHGIGRLPPKQRLTVMLVYYLVMLYL